MSVTLHTNYGDMKMELFCEEAPNSCKNFLVLAASGVYNGTLFHRSVPGFILQGGDPTGTGKGGVSWRGEMMDNEASALELKHDRRGIVSLANTPGKPNSVGSQFFITYARQPSLNGEYPVIGRLIDGLDVLQAIESLEVSEKKYRPLVDVRIESVEIHANPIAESELMRPSHASKKLPPCGFYVRTKETSNELPIRIKKVAKGKRVTVMSSIVGSREKAVVTLRQLLGVGGELSADQADGIELQGDQSGRLVQVLKNLDALVESTPSPVKTVDRAVTVKRHYEYDKFAKDGGGRTKDTSLEARNTSPMSKACVLVHGTYWPYCTGSCSYCPPLTDVFDGLDIYCAWFDPNEGTRHKASESMNSDPMTVEELNNALSFLGLKAEPGQAIRNYQEERHKRVDDFQSALQKRMQRRSDRRTVVVVPSVEPVRRKKSSVPSVPSNRTVRVILNRPADICPFYRLHVQMADPSQWMSECEDFVLSLVAESVDGPIVGHSLEDSRTMEVRFENRSERDLCEAVLRDSAEGFLILKKTDPIVQENAWEDSEDLYDIGLASEEEVPEEILALDESDEILSTSDMLRLQRMADELGLGDSEQLWEVLCDLIDQSRVEVPIDEVFAQAVLKVTQNAAEQTSEEDLDDSHKGFDYQEGLDDDYREGFIDL